MVKWRDRDRSDNIEDRRGGAGMAGMAGIVLLLLRFVFSRFGIGGVVVLVGGFFALRSIGIDPVQLIASQGSLVGLPSGGGQISAADQELGDFVSVILNETEETWGRRFAEEGRRYEEPKLVLFSRATTSGCGPASSAMGPFYCPADRRVYIDTSFFDEMSRRFGASGDFAAAFVVAHEVGHHVQTLQGISAQVRAVQSRSSEVESNAIQVKMELQADCYAGVWAHDADRIGILEAGDIEEGVRAAAAVGDDAIQRAAGRHVHPESFTHGSSDQRARWFTIGYRQGVVAACDTFNAGQL